jgi:hypothetical protein
MYLGLTRDEVDDKLGPPDLIAATTRKYKNPLVYRYGSIEFNFMPSRDGVCISVFDESIHETLCYIDKEGVKRP